MSDLSDRELDMVDRMLADDGDMRPQPATWRYLIPRLVAEIRRRRGNPELGDLNFKVSPPSVTEDADSPWVDTEDGDAQ